MSFADTVADDYRVVDATETVTLTTVRAGGDTDYPVNYADPHDFTAQEINAMEGMFAAGDRRWGLGHAELAEGVQPLRGDRVTEADGTVWELLADANLDDLEVSWFCPSRKARGR